MLQLLQIRHSSVCNPLPLQLTHSFLTPSHSSSSVQRSRGGVTPIECLHLVMRNMIHDSKLRQRNNITTIFKAILGVGVRGKALDIPSVKEIMETSVAVSPSFVLIPYLSPAASGGPGSPSPTSTGSAPVVTPVASPVAKGKKVVSAVEAEVRSAPLAQVFLDTDWLLDSVIDEILETTITSSIESRVAAVLSKLDKLPGKLGFSPA